jgi:hypothetical protein
MKILPRTERLAYHGAPLLIGLILIGCSSTPLSSASNSSSQVTAASESPAAADSGSRSPTSPPPTASAEATASTFTSSMYGYSVAVPAGWSSAAATARWDGVSGTSSDSPENDRWISTGTASAWAGAAAYAKDLASYTTKTIADTAKYHGDTCKAPPEAQEAITIGDEPGTLLSWDCGILINVGVTVHNGIGYTFGFRDPAVQAATDPADRAIFIDLLKSLRFPG